ncbi:hypothetical protein ACFUKV_40075 [Streptomyces paradoxus]|uniref:hypothetical protein n=1 Tax=Streptomyces paradoxus TaxID=66375 RepID=UPI003631C1C9
MDVLSLYSGSGRTSAQQSTDLLYWFRVSGWDIDDALDRAQSHFEAEFEARLS